MAARSAAGADCAASIAHCQPAGAACSSSHAATSAMPCV